MCDQDCSTMSAVHGKMKDYGWLALRIAVAFVFIYSGYMKLGPNHAMTSGMFGKLIGPEMAGSFWAYFVGLAEFGGGLMVLLGIFASYAAAWLAIIMVVAIFVAHWGGPISGYFLTVTLLGSCLALVGNGAGRFRLVKTECHCPKCKMATNDKGGCCDDKKPEVSSCCKDKK